MLWYFLVYRLWSNLYPKWRFFIPNPTVSIQVDWLCRYVIYHPHPPATKTLLLSLLLLLFYSISISGMLLADDGDDMEDDSENQYRRMLPQGCGCEISVINNTLTSMDFTIKYQLLGRSGTLHWIIGMVVILAL